jgi:hypothetical protein
MARVLEVAECLQSATIVPGDTDLTQLAIASNGAVSILQTSGLHTDRRVWPDHLHLVAVSTPALLLCRQHLFTLLHRQPVILHVGLQPYLDCARTKGRQSNRTRDLVHLHSKRIISRVADWPPCPLCPRIRTEVPEACCIVRGSFANALRPSVARPRSDRRLKCAPHHKQVQVHAAIKATMDELKRRVENVMRQRRCCTYR